MCPCVLCSPTYSLKATLSPAPFPDLMQTATSSILLALVFMQLGIDAYGAQRCLLIVCHSFFLSGEAHSLFWFFFLLSSSSFDDSRAGVLTFITINACFVVATSILNVCEWSTSLF